MMRIRYWGRVTELTAQRGSGDVWKMSPVHGGAPVVLGELTVPPPPVNQDHGATEPDLGEVEDVCGPGRKIQGLGRLLGIGNRIRDTCKEYCESGPAKGLLQDGGEQGSLELRTGILASKFKSRFEQLKRQVEGIISDTRNRISSNSPDGDVFLA